MKLWLKITIIVIVTVVVREIINSEHRILRIYCTEDYSSSGILAMVESANLERITDLRKLKSLLSDSEYQLALDTSYYYHNDGTTKTKHVWRARDYIEYQDSIIIEKNFTAKLILVYDNALIDSAGGDREYFFQIRTYTKGSELIDQTEFATWSKATNTFCSGVLNKSYYLFRSCDGNEEVKRINQNGYFILPSKRMIAWQELKGY